MRGVTGSGVMRLAGRPKRPQEPHVGIGVGVCYLVLGYEDLLIHDQFDDSIYVRLVRCS